MKKLQNYIRLVQFMGEDIQVRTLKYREVINLHLVFQMNEITPRLECIIEANKILNNIPTERYTSDYCTALNRWMGPCVSFFIADMNTRRAVIRFPENSCLISIQFLYRLGKLYTYASFRSMELSEFAEYDLALLQQICNRMQREIGVPLGSLYVQVGSAHIQVNDK